VIGLPPTLRIYVATAPVDLRKSYDGLAQVARDALGQDPTSGHLFVFSNRRHNRIKMLYWDRDGFAIWMKRLEIGSLRWPSPGADRVELTPAELAAMLGGIDLKATRKRPRYALPPA
jgi:transposase